MLEQANLAFFSTFKPNIFEEASDYEHQLAVMNEYLDQIENNDTWELVP